MAILQKILLGYDKIHLTDEIINRAVSLRQHKKMGLGDAIVAASALSNDCTLWTANTEDFAHISDLKLFNPLS